MGKKVGFMRSRSFATVLLVLLAVGCEANKGGSTVDVPEIGLRMRLPAGWRVDSQNRRMFIDAGNKDNLGLVEDYPLEGKTLSEYVRQFSKIGPLAASMEAVSHKPATISGLEAIEMVTRAIEATVIEVDIRKGDSVIRVSFRTRKEDFPAHERSFREAFRSISIK